MRGRKRAYFFTSVKLFLRENKFFVLIGCLCLLLGIIAGVLAARSFGEEYYRLNFIFELQEGTYSFAKTFFFALLSGAGGCALILLCGANRWLAIPAFFLIAFVGYRLGLGLVGCLSPSGAGGAACIVFYWLPLYLTGAACGIYVICVVFTSLCGVRGVFSSPAAVKRVLRRCLLPFLCFAAAALLCCVIVPLAYKLIFM